MPRSFTAVLDDRETEVQVLYDYTPGTPARGWAGPPENYDPGSGPEVVITGIVRLHDSRLLNLDAEPLGPAVIERIIAEIIEQEEG